MEWEGWAVQLNVVNLLSSFTTQSTSFNSSKRWSENSGGEGVGSNLAQI